MLVATIIISILLINGWLNRANDSTGPTTPDESSRNLDVTTAPAHTSGFTLHNNRFEQRMCLDADLNGHSSNGTKVQLWACNGSVQQRWDYEGDPYTTGALIRSVQWPAMCLDADTNTIGGNGTKVQLWTCNGFAQQQWQE
nr:ricin-type beta-trefoil lectin domain protein [Protofrankia symbiont of Coriaria ruscifolia]